MLEGRPLAETDRRGAPLVVVVNRTMARLYWPGESALGKCLHIGQGSRPCARVVGIAENTRRQEVIEGDSLLYYAFLAAPVAVAIVVLLATLVPAWRAGRIDPVTALRDTL